MTCNKKDINSTRRVVWKKKEYLLVTGDEGTLEFFKIQRKNKVSQLGRANQRSCLSSNSGSRATTTFSRRSRPTTSSSASRSEV